MSSCTLPKSIYTVEMPSRTLPKWIYTVEVPPRTLPKASDKLPALVGRLPTHFPAFGAPPSGGLFRPPTGRRNSHKAGAVFRMNSIDLVKVLAESGEYARIQAREISAVNENGGNLFQRLSKVNKKEVPLFSSNTFSSNSPDKLTLTRNIALVPDQVYNSPASFPLSVNWRANATNFTLKTEET